MIIICFNLINFNAPILNFNRRFFNGKLTSPVYRINRFIKNAILKVQRCIYLTNYYFNIILNKTDMFFVFAVLVLINNKILNTFNKTIIIKLF